jgi:hypothetical protein
MWYLLIVSFSGGVDHVSFTDKDSCLEARKVLIAEAERGIIEIGLRAVCVPKFNENDG